MNLRKVFCRAAVLAATVSAIAVFSPVASPAQASTGACASNFGNANVYDTHDPLSQTAKDTPFDAYFLTCVGNGTDGPAGVGMERISLYGSLSGTCAVTTGSAVVVPVFGQVGGTVTLTGSGYVLAMSGAATGLLILEGTLGSPCTALGGSPEHSFFNAYAGFTWGV